MNEIDKEKIKIKEHKIIDKGKKKKYLIKDKIYKIKNLRTNIKILNS